MLMTNTKFKASVVPVIPSGTGLPLKGLLPFGKKPECKGVNNYKNKPNKQTKKQNKTKQPKKTQE